MARKKGGILTLLFSIVLFVASILGFSYVLLASQLPKDVLEVVEPIRDRIVANFAITADGGRIDPLIVPSIFLLLESFMTLHYRRKKPYSLIFAFYLYLVYFTFLAFFHLEAGLDTPLFLMRRIDMSKRPLIAVLIFLECLLALVLKYLTHSLDMKWRQSRVELDHETFEDVEVDDEDGNAVVAEGRKARRAQIKAAKKAEKEKAKEQARQEKLERKAAEDLKKEEAAYAKAEEKKQRKEAKAAEKKRRKEEPTLEVGESFDTRSFYEDGQIPVPPKAQDGDSPLSFPELSEIPRMDTIEHSRDIDRVSESDYDRMQRNLGLKDDYDDPATRSSSGGFMVDPADIPSSDDDDDSFSVGSRGEERTSFSGESHVKYDPNVRNSHFKSGGMLEATIESLNDYPSRRDNAQERPIVGLERPVEDIVPVKEKKSNFAPSNLSKDHPRYKLFESLRNSGPQDVNVNVSHVPSMPFHAENQEPAGQYGSTFISLEDQKPSASERLYEMKTEAFESTNPRVQVPSSEVSSFDRTRINAPRPRYEDIGRRSQNVAAEQDEEKPSFHDEDDFKDLGENTYTSSDNGDDEIGKRIPKHDPFQKMSGKKLEPLPPLDMEDDGMPVRRATPARNEDVPSLDEEHKGRYDDGSAEVKQENALQYTFGIVGLQSNNAGMSGIRERARMKYHPPTTDILVEYPTADREIDDYTIRRGEIIVSTLQQFKVDVKLENIVKGPTVTMYELKLAEGVPVSKVKCRYDDICYYLGLGNNALRILAPIPGKQAIGMEVPNKKRSVIGFKDMLDSLEKDQNAKKMAIPMILGRTITGTPVIIDVAKTPHLLIAGSTGSGKSVGINSFIATLLYKKSPQDVRLILIDPKVVELTMYNGIPHLLTPVITEAKKVQKVLAWLTEEMERRYRMISMFSVRNIAAFNEKLKEQKLAAEKLPYIVLIMDEYADLMTTIGKDIEYYVGRLTAMARAVGIHLVLATQRPSMEVVTGTIKNNIPARIAFAVSSGVNSKIILDEVGAESLLGKGDMLYKSPTSIGLERIQGAFLTDKETEEIVEQVKTNGEPDYLDDAIFEDFDDHESDDDMDDYSDAIDNEEEEYERAKQIVYEKKSASASYLQRRMKIGYNKAARYVERMEEEGIVGPPNGSKPRELLKML